LVIKRYVKIAETILHQRRQKWRGVDRVYVNATLFGDYNFCHRDGCDWTALAFVNDEWRDHWGGELMLYRDGDLDAPAIAIRPKPGRMVIFDGHMVHRPGVPTKYCLEPRVTLACKIGEGRPTGKRPR
jgi:SM-20-related protein